MPPVPKPIVGWIGATGSIFLPDTVRVDASHVFFNESNVDGFRILRADKSSGEISDLAARGDNVQVGSLELASPLQAPCACKFSNNTPSSIS